MSLPVLMGIWCMYRLLEPNLVKTLIGLQYSISPPRPCMFLPFMHGREREKQL